MGHRATIEDVAKQVEEALASVSHAIAVLSGKGGVGKSFVAASLAIAMSMMGKRVGILDADFHGPSIPWMLGIEREYLGATIEGKLIPVRVEGIAVVSPELLLEDRGSPIVWRGPMKSRAILELLTKVEWGPLDYLVIDLPPGTGDEPLTIAQFLKNKLRGFVLVLTPSSMVKHIVSKANHFAKLLGVPVLGSVINMAYFVCPNCGAKHYIFGRIESIEGVEVLGEIPIDPDLARAIENGELVSFIRRGGSVTKALVEIARRIDEVVGRSHGGEPGRPSESESDSSRDSAGSRL